MRPLDLTTAMLVVGAASCCSIQPLAERPPNAIEAACPAESAWDGSACVRTRVVTRVQCPYGARWEDNDCVVDAEDVRCPKGSKPDGNTCLREVVAVKCPKGAKWDGQHCLPIDAARIDTTNCAPPWVEDPQGNRRYKRGCFK